MKAVVQRVLHASVETDGEVVGAIEKGFLVFLGVGAEDSPASCDKLAAKITALRIFEDGEGKTNLSLSDVGGALLVVSQFTLYADTSRGNRPSFTAAGGPDLAIALYERFIESCSRVIPHVAHGVFGADMKVSLVNDGPFTILYDI